MLFASPFVYLLFALLSIFSVWLKKYPIVIGILQLLFVVLFMIISSSGSIGDDSFELSAHGNFAGIGIYLVGFVSIGYFIPKQTLNRRIRMMYLNTRDPLQFVCIYNASDEQHPLKAHRFRIIVHMGLSIDPCVISITTYSWDQFIRLNRQARS